MKPDTSPPDQQVSPRRSGLHFSALLCLLLALTTSCTTPPRHVPAPVAPDAAVRVNRVLDRLCPALPPRTCRGFGIIASSIPNASMDHKGVIRLTTGLLELANTDDLLAYTLAHELAHAALGHPRISTRQAWLQALATGIAAWAAYEASDSKADAAWTGGGVFLTTSLFATLPAMRRRETEADLYARELLRRTGYRPQAAAEFWQLYASTRPGREMPEFLCAHPPDAARALRLTQP